MELPFLSHIFLCMLNRPVVFLHLEAAPSLWSSLFLFCVSLYLCTCMFAKYLLLYFPNFLKSFFFYCCSTRMAVSFNENELMSCSKVCLYNPLPLVLFSWVLAIKYTVFLPFKGPSSLQSKRLSQWSDFRPPSWQQRALSTRHQAGLIKEDLCILFCKDFLLCDAGVKLQQTIGFVHWDEWKQQG